MSSGSAVVVTGAAGFIGAHLARRLAAVGHEVRALDVRALPLETAGQRVRSLAVDVRDRAAVAAAARGAEVVFHLASVHLEVHAGEREFEEVNVAAAEGVVDACAEGGVRRLVHCSSVGIFGDVEGPPAGEDAPKRPMTAYERTKLAGEEAVLLRAAGRGVDVVVVRPAWVYGPGCGRTRKLLSSVRRGRFFYVGNGSNLRHPVFIEEMIDAFLLAADAPRAASGRTYIIGGPRAVTLRELVATCARELGVREPRLRVPVGLARGLGLGAECAFRLVGKEPPFSRRSLAFFLNNNAFDTSAAERDLGFRPRIDLPEGIRRTLGAAGGAGR
jgi:nucleoside-diphosphate-sugar epimerase